MADEIQKDKLSFRETLMIGLQQQFKESANDGFDREFEDLVDTLMFQISFLIKKDDKCDEWRAIEKIGSDLKYNDTNELLKAKRRRIRKKMILAMSVMNKNGLLLRTTMSHKFDFNPDELE